MKKPKARWLDRRIAAPGPYLTLCTSEPEYLSALNDIGAHPVDDWIKTDHADATVHFAENTDGGLAAIVCVRVAKDRTAIEVAGLLVHESVHVWQRYCERIGERSPAAEQEAYGIQSIAQELLAEYARRLA